MARVAVDAQPQLPLQLRFYPALPGLTGKWGQDEAKLPSERCKERRNPSADVHEKPMSDGEALAIVPPWAWAIRYRPSL
jgi:hypothetical protein